MKLNEKQKEKIKIVLTCIVIVLIVWFLILSPYLKFKKNERTLKKAAIRYYEINTMQAPTGKKIKTVSLQTFYDKGFIEEDLRNPYSNKTCDSKESWVKTKKENGENKHYIYLKCGIFSSRVDHEGPKIKLKGSEEITINKGNKFKDPGIESVVDKVDGKIDIKNVQIDNKKLNTDKIGTYKITYKVKDSFNNETIKIRYVKVTETLNHIVKKDTDKSKIYKGTQYNNYVKLDGIVFKILRENEDGTIRIATNENLAVVNYDGIDKWLNQYFYEKLSDSAKELIVKSKWCNEKVKDPNAYTKCNSYSKKSNIGLLSIEDINNSKDKENNYNVGSYSNIWLSNNKTNNKAWSTSADKYKAENKEKNLSIRPIINIKKNVVILKGTGSTTDPYIIKSNSKKIKVGNKVSEARTGEYITYSGYLWRVIEKEDDQTTEIIMNDIVNLDGENYYVGFSNTSSLEYNPTRKNSIGYYLTNNVSKYMKTNLFTKKKDSFNNYKNDIGYEEEADRKQYSVKVTIPSMYDLFSNTIYGDYWFKDYSSKNKTYCYSYSGNPVCKEYDYNIIQGIRIVGYLKESVKVKNGDGTEINPYTLSS